MCLFFCQNTGRFLQHRELETKLVQSLLHYLLLSYTSALLCRPSQRIELFTNVYVIQLPRNIDLPPLLQTSQRPVSNTYRLFKSAKMNHHQLLLPKLPILAMQACEDPQATTTSAEPKVYVKWSRNHDGRRIFDKKLCFFVTSRPQIYQSIWWTGTNMRNKYGSNMSL